jgi:hypothetical protein
MRLLQRHTYCDRAHGTDAQPGAMPHEWHGKPVAGGAGADAHGDRPGCQPRRALDGCARRGRQGAKLICLPELFRSRYFCQTEDSAHFALAEPVPGPTTEAFARRWPPNSTPRSSSACSSAARRGCSTTPRRCWTARAATRASTARCTSPTTPASTRSTTSPRATSAFAGFDTSAGRLGVLVCWDQWYPEAARLTALRAPKCWSTRRRSAGTRRRRQGSASASTRLGAGPARPRRRQRLLRRVDQPHRLRAGPGGRRRHRVLGPELRRGARRARPGARPGDEEEAILTR